MKTFESTAEWNPLLLAIASRHLNVVKVICEKVKSFHRLNCLSRPYDLETQKRIVFDHNKRLKRECFGLKLAVLNKDEEIFKYLWSKNENRILWNLGHFFYLMKILVKSNWEQGLRLLVGSTTSKVLIMSVNTVKEFVDVVDLFINELENFQA